MSREEGWGLQPGRLRPGTGGEGGEEEREVGLGCVGRGGTAQRSPMLRAQFYATPFLGLGAPQKYVLPQETLLQCRQAPFP